MALDKPALQVLLWDLLQHKINWHGEPHGFWHTGSASGGVAPAKHGCQGGLVEPLVTARCADLGFLGDPVCPDQNTQHHLSLFTQSPAQCRVIRFVILKVVGAAGGQLYSRRLRDGWRCRKRRLGLTWCWICRCRCWQRGNQSSSRALGNCYGCWRGCQGRCSGAGGPCRAVRAG